MNNKVSQGCSKHVGQYIQEYCDDCKQLLCIQCLATTNHHEHQLSKYSDYLGKCTIEAEDYLRRVRNLAERTKEARRTLMNYKKKYDECYRQSLVVLESFTKVSNGMKEWKVNTIDNLEKRKASQLKQLEERILTLKKIREEGNPLQQKMIGDIDIMLPEVLFFKKGIENLKKTIQELSPSYISRQKGREHRSYSLSSSLSSSHRSIRSSCSTSLSTSLLSLASDTSSVVSESDSAFELKQSLSKLQIVQRFQDKELPSKPKRDKNVEMTQDEDGYELCGYICTSAQPPLPNQEQEYENTVFNPGEDMKTPPLTKCDEDIPFNAGEDEIPLPLPPPLSPLPPPLSPLPPPLPRPYSEEQEIYLEIGENEKTPSHYSYVEMMMIHEASGMEEYDNVTSDTKPLSKFSPKHEGEDEEEYDYIPFNTSEDKKIPPPLPPRHSLFQKKVPPFNIIAASCFAQTPNETVSLYDVCSTRDGNIVVSDPDNSCLRIAIGTGENSKKITGRLKEACHPKAVAYDSTHDRVLVSSHHNKENSLGEVKIGQKIAFKVTKLTKNINPIAIASASCTSGGACCYVTVWPKRRDFSVHRLDCTGKFGGKLDVVVNPYGIDYHGSGYLVISDWKEGCLLKTTPEGKALWDKHADARTPGILNQPFGVVILPNEYVAVTESGNHCVSIFSDIGKLVVQFGCKGSDPGEFNNPQGMCLHSCNQIIIVDSGNRRLQIFSLESLELFFIATDEQNVNTTICTDDDVYVTMDAKV